MSTPSDFVGRGWAWTRPPPDTQHEPDDVPALLELTADGEASVRESIEVILGTAPGERVMRPDFGCAVHDLVFAPNTASTAGAASQAVREALVLWEPRIEVEDVSAAASGPTALVIEVRYRIRATNSRANLVYPFRLG